MPRKDIDKTTSGDGIATHDEWGNHPLLVMAINRGWRLLPLKRHDKIPLIKEWPKAATTDKGQILAWMKRYHGCNWGVATGVASNLLVVDVDSDAAYERLKNLGQIPNTFTVKTAHGQHFYFQHPKTPISNSVSTLVPGVDIRAEGGQVVFPPSVHPSGAVYTIIDKCDPAPAPEWLCRRLQGNNSDNSKTIASDNAPSKTKTIPKGARNSTLASLAGTMHKKGMPPQAIEAALMVVNSEQCETPLSFNEVKKTVKSITTLYEPGGRDGEDGSIVLGEAPLAAVVPNAETILKGQEHERIFQTLMSRRLVRVVQSKQDSHSDSDVQRDPETCLLTEVDVPYLQLALGRSGRIFRLNSKKEKILVDAPRKLAEMVLSSVKTSPEMTSWFRLKKISQTPVLLASGEIVMLAGYHAGAQIWIDPRGIDFIDPAFDNPKLSAAECAKLLETHIHPFASQYSFLREQDGLYWYQTGAFAVVLSAMMSIDDRHNLPAVPMHCVSAPSQACGKTRLVQAICVAATGTQPTIVTYDGAEEFAKHIPVLLGKGDSAICVDNVIMPVNNAKLAALLTQENTFNYRPLGASADVAIENVSVLFATGVNLQLSGDMPTRCLLARIEPDTERPEQKRFPFDQVERARKLFPHAVMAIKAILRAHQLNGFPGERLLKNASRFPVWDRRVRAAIVWAGYADPIITQELIRSDDPLRTENLRVLWILRDKFRDAPFLTRDVSKLSQESLDVLKQITGHRDGETLNERKVGKYFANHLFGRWFEGIRLLKTGKNQGGKQEWKIEAKLDAASFGVEKEEPL